MTTRLLFIDTETTGKDPTKARLCELSIILAECESHGLVDLVRWTELVRPDEMDQFPLPPAQRVHGLDGDLLLAQGQPLLEVLHTLNNHVMSTLRAGGFPKVIGHNIKYDLMVLASEYRRAELPFFLNHLQPFCTMLAMAKLRNTRWESLERCWHHAFGLDADYGAGHRAGTDVEHLYQLYQWGLNRGVWHCD